MLVAELNHRVKNLLAVVQSLATQTLRNSGTLQDFGNAFMGRMQALGRAHDIALRSIFQHIALGSIVDQALDPFKIDGRIEIAKGPLVEFDPVVSQSLTLMLHELATNAVKYGALCNSTGRVSIGWRVDANDGDPRVVLTWTESGGPVVVAPDHTGQGMRFIKGSVRFELKGDATLDFRADGLRATISFPLRKAANTTDVINTGEES